MNAPILNIKVDKGQLIRISTCDVNDDESLIRDVWVVVRSYEDAVISIAGEDLEITQLWQRREDELSKAEER